MPTFIRDRAIRVNDRRDIHKFRLANMSIVKTLFPPGGLAAGGCHATIVLADGTKIYVERDYSLTICPDGRKVTTDSSDFQNPINRIVDRCWDQGRGDDNETMDRPTEGHR